MGHLMFATGLLPGVGPFFTIHLVGGIPFKPRVVLLCPAVERQGLTCGVYTKAKPFFPHYPQLQE